ncbi:YceI family protein [Streptomyces sp. NPDC059582]|uniref:YceI family protein n=1 Tax=Streptomyces sp. NPDC059582 TaxID=3346875 RepID=UPI0036A46783
MLKNRSRDGNSIARFDSTPTGIYIIDPVRSMLGFSFRHAAISDIRGKFNSFEGLLKLDAARPYRSEAYMSVQTGSLETGNRQRDEHLKGPDFFDSATFPLLTCRSIGFEYAGNEGLRLIGDVRIRDIELPIAIDLKFGSTTQEAAGRERVECEGRAALKPSDWGLISNTPLHAGGVRVSNEISLVMDISAVRVFQAPPA